MVVTRSQTRALRAEQNANNNNNSDSDESQQSPPRPVRRRQPRRRAPATRARRSRKRRRVHNEESPEQPEKKQRRMDKKEKDMLGMQLLSELICPVCTEIVSGPVTLHCGHSFCFICLCKHIDTRYPTAVCPLCRVPIGRTYEPKVSILFQNAIDQMLSSRLFEDSLEKKTYQTRQTEYLAFKLDREQNPPLREPCGCDSCRRNREERQRRYLLGVDGFQRPLIGAETDDEDFDAIQRRMFGVTDESSPEFDAFGFRSRIQPLASMLQMPQMPRVVSLTTDDDDEELSNSQVNDEIDEDASDSEDDDDDDDDDDDNDDDEDDEQRSRSSSAASGRYPLRRTRARRRQRA